MVMDVTPAGTVKSPEVLNACDPDWAYIKGIDIAIVRKVKIFLISYSFSIT